jgi:transglutaminase/protease-like cytokinesis protein 3
MNCYDMDRGPSAIREKNLQNLDSMNYKYWMKNNILFDYRCVCISYGLLYRYKFNENLADISCVVVDEFLKTGSLPTN